MSLWPQVSLVYDGSFAGFLCCVAHSFRYKEYPFYFFTPDDMQTSLYPLREVERRDALAKKVYAFLKTKLSLSVRQMVEYAFLTCLPQRERHIYDFIYANVFGGPILDHTDERVFILNKAIRHLMGETEKLLGFVRFSDYQGLLVSEISPKNRVLPLLRPHFCSRFSSEAFLIHDLTHKEALLYAGNQWKILPLDELCLETPDESELRMRGLWKEFYQRISITERKNPKLQISHMPKRYHTHLTELN